MDALLRAAVVRRDREQAIGAATLEEFVDADERRAKVLDASMLSRGHCSVCGGRLNASNTYGVCSKEGPCRREHRRRWTTKKRRTQ